MGLGLQAEYEPTGVLGSIASCNRAAHSGPVPPLPMHSPAFTSGVFLRPRQEAAAPQARTKPPSSAIVLPVRKLTDDETTRCSDMSAAEVHGVKEVVTLLPGSMGMNFHAF